MNINTLTNQDYQKSVVVFGAGLLVGGLLVWVFSAPATVEEKKELTKDTNNQQAAVVPVTQGDVETQSNNSVSGGIVVTSTKAGDVVDINVSLYPAEEGWVAVRDYTDGIFGNVLGATRYSKSEDRYPTQVNLMRATEAGKTYVAVFYSADTEFDLTKISMVEGVKAEFTVE